MQNYTHSDWKAALSTAALADFDALWELDADWFEEPNIRRGGWSGVSRIEVDVPGRGKVGLFLKRQENHCSRTWLHPISGIATFEKEFNNIQLFQRINIPGLTAVYFGKRKVEGKLQAILITEELDGYLPLSSEAIQAKTQNTTSRKALLHAVAELMQTMLKHNLAHNVLFPKHIFAKQEAGEWLIKIIDLEKTQHHFSKQNIMLRELGTLHRYADKAWTVSDRITLLRYYREEKKLSAESRKMILKVVKKIAVRRKRSEAKKWAKESAGSDSH